MMTMMMRRRRRRLNAKADQPRDGSVEPVVLTAEVVDSWMSAADERTWIEIESVLRQLEREHPWRVGSLRRNLVWMRKEAAGRGYKWGREVIIDGG